MEDRSSKNLSLALLRCSSSCCRAAATACADTFGGARDQGRGIRQRDELPATVYANAQLCLGDLTAVFGKPFGAGRVNPSTQRAEPCRSICSTFMVRNIPQRTARTAVFGHCDSCVD